MIVTKRKPLEEILENLSRYRKVLVVGCDGCTTPPRGLREAESLALLIEMGEKSKGIELSCKATTVVKQCDNQIVATSLEPQLEDIEAVLALSCGVGAQIVSEVFPDVPVYPGQNTVFIGSQERESGTLYEKCSACGNCILDRTFGICPVTRCSKSLLNGPCGGSKDGKCEVNKEIDCAWQLIYDRAKKVGRLDVFEEIEEARDWSTSWHGGLRKIEVG